MRTTTDLTKDKCNVEVGRFVLHRFNGDEEFHLGSAKIMALPFADGVRLWFEANADEGRVASVPDTASEPVSPCAEVSVALKKFDPSDLVGRRFSVPFGYDEQSEDYVATIYYFEHAFMNNNEVEVVARTGNVFHVRWTGTTEDVNYYDGSKPETRIEIEGHFTLSD